MVRVCGGDWYQSLLVMYVVGAGLQEVELEVTSSVFCLGLKFPVLKV